MEIKTQKDSGLMSRKEVTAKVTYTGPTPKSAEIKKSLASKMSVDEKLIVIKHVYPVFGTGSAEVIAYAYKDEKALSDIEPKQKQKKDKNAPADPKKPDAKKPDTKKKSGSSSSLSNVYEISGSTIKRKNKFCPKCGSGVFMAQHKNRSTCGKCHYTEFSTKQ